jgi:hypothetical protein
MQIYGLQFRIFSAQFIIFKELHQVYLEYQIQEFFKIQLKKYLPQNISFKSLYYKELFCTFASELGYGGGDSSPLIC